MKPEQFKKRYADVLKGDQQWQALKVKEGATFEWDPKSTYVRKPPFFDGMPKDPHAGEGHQRRAVPGAAG